jgi:hypothetical protein
MALLTKTREVSAPAQLTDGLVRTCVLDVDGETQVWCEWQVQLPNGKYRTQSVRCDPAVEAEIFALPNFSSGLMKAADNTHPKVSA